MVGLRHPLTALGLVLLAALAVEAQSGGRPLNEPLTAIDGSKIDIADGRAFTELVVVATWCEPCEREVAGLRRRLGSLRRGGYRAVLVGVSKRQSSEQFAEWARSIGFAAPLVYDSSGRIERLLGAKLLPWYVVLDRSGKVVHASDGPPTMEQLKSWSGS